MISMESATKSTLNENDIITIFKGLFPLVKYNSSKELKDGCFNLSYLVLLENGAKYVLKVSPTNNNNLLSYETDMMSTEVYFHTRVIKELNIPIPKVIFSDFSKTIIKQNYYIMDKLEGTPLDKIENITDIQREVLYTQLAKHLASMHGLNGRHFGYKVMEQELYGLDYFDAFKFMFNKVLLDGVKVKAVMPQSLNSIMVLLDQYAESFNIISEPCFVHYDLWDGNIFVLDMDSSPKIEGLIDFERGFFADPAADFSQIAGYIDLEKNKYFIDTYNEYSKRSFTLGKHEKSRISLYQLYLFSIMIVESYYRDVDGSYTGQLNWASGEFQKLFKKLSLTK